MRVLADVTREQAAKRPDQVALTYVNDGRSWTFAELDAESNRVAQALLAAGVEPGERIAYLERNAPEYFPFLFGGAKVNAVSVAVNWRLAVPEMEYILNDSRSRVLLVGEEFLEGIGRMHLPGISTVIVLGHAGDTGFPTWDQWLAGHQDIDPEIPVGGEDTCYQLYTSGTTGLPKGVELTQANFLACLSDSLAALDMDENTVNLVCMPLFHISGSGWGVVGLFHGARSLMLRDVDLPRIVHLIGEERITHTLFVPAVLQFLLAVPGVGEADFSSLHSITYGASPIAESVLVRAMEIFGCRFFQAYGLTETTGVVSLLHDADHDPGGPRANLLRSCGKPIDTHEIRIVDSENLEAMEEGEVGEIWVRGPQVMKGYWNNPDANRDAFVDGWFRTGDAGYLRDGYLYIHDRVKDMIISGGENIYPAEIENVLMQHPAIADAAVIGVPDDRWGESVKAIVRRTGEALGEEAVMRYCRERLAHYKCPTSVDWVDEMPRNPSGKILKTELRKPYWARQDRQVS